MACCKVHNYLMDSSMRMLGFILTHTNKVDGRWLYVNTLPQLSFSHQINEGLESSLEN